MTNGWDFALCVFGGVGVGVGVYVYTRCFGTLHE